MLAFVVIGHIGRLEPRVQNAPAASKARFAATAEGGAAAAGRAAAAAATQAAESAEKAVLRQPPKPAQVSRSYRGLPGYFQEYLCGHRFLWLCH